ncbi:MAP kinase [Amanita rubescens]|nr:MAP kinase [Amanita rubescens]
MLDDLRGPRHRRRLYIANPDPDDAIDDRDDEPPAERYGYYPHYNWTNPVYVPQQHSPPTPSRYNPPLTAVVTNNISHPRPSPDHSPAPDDSPPALPPLPHDPSTPDLPLSDLSTPPADRSTSDPTHSWSARSFRTLTSPAQQHTRGPRPVDPLARRPRVSPTVSVPDTNTPTSAHATLTPAADKSDLNKLLIVVTADSERYVTVDISGAKNAAFIRECIFSKLKICQDEEQPQFSIYKTEIGDFAIGKALTDDQLFSLCRDRGDNKGSLKFLISHKSAVVHEEPHRPYTPVISSIPPPVLPGLPSSPLRAKPRSRSRHGSASSSSEPMTAEATGYEADLDNAEKEKDSLKRQPPLPPPPIIRKVGSPPIRPSSPLKISSSPQVPQAPQPDVPLADAYGPPKNVSPNLPSLSPVRPAFPICEEGTMLPPISSSLPTRPGLDIGGESTSKLPQPCWKARPPQPQQQHPKLRSESPREDLPFPVKEHQVRADEVRQEEDWTLVSSPAETESNTPTQEHLRQHGSPVRYVPPGPYPTRLKAPRPPAPPSRHVVPSNYLVAWKGEEGIRKNGLSSTSPTTRLGKGVKSMENIRAATQRRNPLPVSRPTHGPHRENSYYNGVGAGLPKSYEPSSRAIRPLPLQGSMHSSSLDLNSRPSYSYNTSLSNNDSLARPQSSGENATPTSTNLRHPNDLLDNTRPPRSVSPHHSHRTLLGQPTRHHLTDAHNGNETLRTSPPRSPASPQSPQYTPHTNGVDTVLSSKHGVLDEDELSAKSANGSDATMRQEDRTKISDLIGNNSESTLIFSSRMNEADKATPPSPCSTTSATTLATSPGSPYSGGDNDSDSELGTMIWKKRPDDVKKRGPCLTVQTDQVPDVPEEINTNRPSTEVLEDQGLRLSTFNMSDSVWAPRPPAEDVYDRLEDFFPLHDLDKPVIEAGSGSTSPTAAESIPSNVQSPHPPESPEKKGGIRARKSIRYVAEDFKKRIDRKASAYANMKRNTKLWGSKMEEVTTVQPRSNSIPSDSSPSSAPTFKWVRGELIGKGTYGRVYLAMNANTGEMMAVKQVELPQTASDRNDSRQTSVVQALKLESETLKELDHPHIVQYLGFEETPANLSIFLEYVPGGSVGTCLLKHGRFDENVTKSFTYQILDGLDYLHSKGILHRDLKADNILVEMSGICKISDFGISKRTDDIGGGAFTAMQGTVFWMAPEVINTQKKGYNFKVDIWSVGCVVLEMWAGKRPWTGEEMVAVMFKLYQSKLPPPVPEDVKLSEQADDFRMRCFAINPEERATAAELMVHPYLRLPPDWHFISFT